MTVRRLRTEMTHPEYIDWIAFIMNEQEDREQAEAIARQRAAQKG